MFTSEKYVYGDIFEGTTIFSCVKRIYIRLKFIGGKSLCRALQNSINFWFSVEFLYLQAQHFFPPSKKRAIVVIVRAVSESEADRGGKKRRNTFFPALNLITTIKKITPNSYKHNFYGTNEKWEGRVFPWTMRMNSHNFIASHTNANKSFLSQDLERGRCKIKKKKARKVSCASQNINPICISPLCSWFSCFLHLARLFCWCRGREAKRRKNCRLMIINRPLVHEKQIKTSLWTLWKSNNLPGTKPKLHHFAQEKRREENF